MGGGVSSLLTSLLPFIFKCCVVCNIQLKPNLVSCSQTLYQTDTWGRGSGDTAAPHQFIYPQNLKGKTWSNITNEYH